MCHILPLYRFEVTESRMDKALDAIRKACAVLSSDQAFEVLYEVGLDGGVSFDEEHHLQLDLTELQYVAAAAAISAAAETHGRQVLNEQPGVGA